MKALIVANWKMNPLKLKDAKALALSTKKAVSRTKGIDVIVAAPAVFVRDISTRTPKSRVFYALQNIHSESAGSYTGEISALQAKDAGATHVLIGHAERRALGETNEDTQKKVSAALAAQLIPILCVGESTRESDADYYAVVKEQLRGGLQDISEKKIGKVLIAYEPVWAIGGSIAMQPRDMHEMSIFIHKTLVERFGDVGHSLKVLYGGSVDGKNAVDMLKNGDVKGLLVGRVSVDADAFTSLIQTIDQA